MSRIGVVAGRSVERSARVIAVPWAATIGMTLLFHWVFEVIRVAAAPADGAVQRLGGRPGVDFAVLNQTPSVYSMPLLTQTGDGNYGPPAARTGRAPLLDCRQWAPAYRTAEPSVPQRRQRRRPSMLAISAALHGGGAR
ncbi:MAG: hypothetical protein J2P17_06285 [Mycobacterium sp.]|nr:hypothetical protein [Mycobacterium sp.]